MTAVERYLRLGLQLGRHVEGIVDAYFGPPELAAVADAEPPVDPHALVSAAEELLDELEDGWLRDQVIGLCTYASALAGESGSYADEVEGATACGRPTPTRQFFEARTNGSRSCSPATGRWPRVRAVGIGNVDIRGRADATLLVHVGEALSIRRPAGYARERQRRAEVR